MNQHDMDTHDMNQHDMDTHDVGRHVGHGRGMSGVEPERERACHVRDSTTEDN